MLNSQLIICQFCKRDNFKSLRGLHQHLSRNKFCADKARSSGVNFETNKAATLELNGEPLNKDLAAIKEGIGAILDEDQQAWQQLQHGSPNECARSSNNNNMATNFDATNDDMAGSLQSSFELLNVDSFDEAPQIYFGVNEDEAVPSSESISQFKEYVAKAYDEFAKLTKDEVCGIKLMDLLHRKKATLDTYDAVMEWHF